MCVHTEGSLKPHKYLRGLALLLREAGRSHKKKKKTPTKTAPF